jgi:hypothetical protein
MEWRADDRKELEEMRESGFKREIEAVCEIWEGGLVGYLTWKLSKVLGLEENTIEKGVEEDNILFDETRGEDNITSDMGIHGLDSSYENKDSEIGGTDFLALNEMQGLALLKTNLKEEDITALRDHNKENQYFVDLAMEDILALEDMDLDYIDIDMIRDF